MSLIYCPECGHEISAAAVACPNCGRPIQARPVVERKVVATPVRDDSGIPKWAIVPIVAVGGLILLFIFVMMSRNGNSDNENLRVNVATSRPANGSLRTESQTIDVPSTTGGQTVNVPPAMPEGQTVTVPGSQTGITAAPSKGSVVIDARIAPKTGSPRPVRNARFYLLDKDLETILSEANIEPIDGQTLADSLGLATVFPDRYGDFNRKAQRAIKEHIKYAGQTDAQGKAQLGNIEPNSYYLFGVTSAGSGFALWNAPVSIIAGQNVLNLAPQQVNEIQAASGE